MSEKATSRVTAPPLKRFQSVQFILAGLSLLVALSAVIGLVGWFPSFGKYPNSHQLVSGLLSPWAFCTEDTLAPTLYCSIGVKWIRSFETPVAYQQIENWYKGRSLHLSTKETGIDLKLGPQFGSWDEGPAVAAADMGIRVPHFTPGLTHFFVIEEYSLELGFKH